MSDMHVPAQAANGDRDDADPFVIASSDDGDPFIIAGVPLRSRFM